MTKTWETKHKILKFMRNGKKMPSEICTELKLSPATVTQHLQELEAMGAIKRVENPFVKKWRYFETNPEFNAKMENKARITKPKITYIAAIAILLVAAGAIALISAFQLHVAGSAQVTVPVRLTDPPTVPNGTQALLINYSSVEVHLKGKNNITGWVKASGTGSVNLLSLINESVVIGSATLPQSSAVDMIRFNVTSASIEINGTYYNVTVPNGSVLAHVSGNGNINSSAGLLLDLSPVVVTMYTNTSTIFVLVPSVRAIITSKGNVNLSVGTRTGLSENDRYNLENAKANMSITSAALLQNGNITTFSITVKNNGNQSLQLSHLLIYGNETATINPQPGLHASGAFNNSISGSSSANKTDNAAINDNESASVSIPDNKNVSKHSHANGSVTANLSINANITVQDRPDVFGGFGYYGMGAGLNGTVNLTGLSVGTLGSGHEPIEMLVNGSRVGINGSFGTSLIGREDAANLFRVSKQIINMRVLNFQITQNGQLLLPFSSVCARYSDNGTAQSTGNIAVSDNSSADFCAYGDVPRIIGEGYALAPGKSVTLTFSGTASLAFGHIIMSLIPGDNYRIIVGGSDGAYAVTNVTAA
jgi:DNA-binding transcriptional ArsR family regulator